MLMKWLSGAEGMWWWKFIVLGRKSRAWALSVGEQNEPKASMGSPDVQNARSSVQIGVAEERRLSAALAQRVASDFVGAMLWQKQNAARKRFTASRCIRPCWNR